jgi:galactoside O-acetyltransferase
VNSVWREVVRYVDALFAAWPGWSGTWIRTRWVAARVGRWGGEGVVADGIRLQGPERLFFGRGVRIGSRAFFAADGGGRVEIGDRVAFNVGAHINASIGGVIRIGDDSLIGPNVTLRTSGHRFEAPTLIREQGHVIGDIVMGRDVWLGANVVVLGGVHIGDGAVVGAGAVVTTDVPTMSVVAGVPARVIRTRRGDTAGP